MTTTKALLGIVPTLQAASLVGHNLKVATKKKVSTKDILGLGITNIVGVSLIGMESDLISGL